MQNDDWRGEHLIRCIKPDPNAGKDFVAKEANRKAKVKQADRLKTRRDKVEILAAKNLTVREIADAMGETECTIRHDVKIMKLPVKKGVRTGVKLKK